MKENGTKSDLLFVYAQLNVTKWEYLASVLRFLLMQTFHPCADLGVLAWVTVNFLTGKTLLVFYYGGVSGQEAHI